MIKKFYFKTSQEADAFIEGVEYVNDSAITVLGKKIVKEEKEYPHLVTLEDEDATPEED